MASLPSNSSAKYVEEAFASITVDIDAFPEFYDSQPPTEVWSDEVDARGLKMKVCFARVGNNANSNLLWCALYCDVPPDTRYNIAWRANYKPVTGYPLETTELDVAQPSSERSQWELRIHPDDLRDTKLIVSYTPVSDEFVEQTYYVNKTFLSSIPPYFKSMFYGEFAERGHVEHHLRDTNPYAFKLEALYDGDVRGDFFTWIEIAKVVDYLDIGVHRRRFESDVHRLMAGGASARLFLQYGSCLKSSTAQKLIIQAAPLDSLQRYCSERDLLPDAVSTFRRRVKKDGNA